MISHIRIRIRICMKSTHCFLSNNNTMLPLLPSAAIQTVSNKVNSGKPVKNESLNAGVVSDTEFNLATVNHIRNPYTVYILHISRVFKTIFKAQKQGVGLSADNRSLITQSWVLPIGLCHLLSTQSRDVTFHIPRLIPTLLHTFSVA